MGWPVWSTPTMLRMIGAIGQRHGHGPVGQARPGQGIGDAVDPDGVHIDRSAAGDIRDVIAEGDAWIDGEVGGVDGGQLRGDAGLRLGKPRFDVRGGVFDTEAVGDEGIVFGHEQGPAVGEVERPVDQFLQRAPIHAQEGGIVVDVACKDRPG